MYKLIRFLMDMSTSASTPNAEATTVRHENERQPATEAATGNGQHPLLVTAGGGQPEVVVKRHAKYFKRFLELLPAKLALHDSTRITIAFFAVSGLDVLHSIETTLPAAQRQHIIDWVYTHQVQVPAGATGKARCGGFQGSSTLNVRNSPADCGTNDYKWGHLAMTYTGLGILVTLGDDLSRLDRRAIIEGVAAVQKPDGNFSASIEGNEHDMRFVYCAAAICAMLNDWTGVDKVALANYIKNSMRYDSGISQHYEMESHGGTTFCALAALQLSGQLESTLDPPTLERIKRWLLFRQVDGFNGRPNKPTDTCYSFWIGATLRLLDAFQFSDFKANRSYVMSTQDPIVGGFAKWPGFNSDPFHTYFSLCGLSFLDEPGLAPVMPSLNITERAYARLRQLHRSWQQPAGCEVRLTMEEEEEVEKA